MFESWLLDIWFAMMLCETQYVFSTAVISFLHCFPAVSMMMMRRDLCVGLRTWYPQKCHGDIRKLPFCTGFRCFVDRRRGSGWNARTDVWFLWIRKRWFYKCIIRVFESWHADMRFANECSPTSIRFADALWEARNICVYAGFTHTCETLFGSGPCVKADLGVWRTRNGGF